MSGTFRHNGRGTRSRARRRPTDAAGRIQQFVTGSGVHVLSNGISPWRDPLRPVANRACDPSILTPIPTPERMEVNVRDQGRSRVFR